MQPDLDTLDTFSCNYVHARAHAGDGYQENPSNASTDHWREGVDALVERKARQAALRAELAECRRLGLIQRQKRRLQLAAARAREEEPQP